MADDKKRLICIAFFDCIKKASKIFSHNYDTRDCEEKGLKRAKERGNSRLCGDFQPLQNRGSWVRILLPLPNQISPPLGGGLIWFDKNEIMMNPSMLASIVCARENKQAKNAFFAQTKVLNPSAPAKNNRTFVSRQKFCFCLSKPQAWHIIAAWSAVYIISP